ncbi:MAG: putative peptidyl-prolyl cis-trans isomerase [Streblomastix strix]|uniref:peptidylprolyl isomerase n=1 Tax=Streblomastix strix TaxID=222440 RepID=A0A5J4X262_9EUKA|nr:MAG: putative peptidyl-prolyl cis-trans isomerase [Streblomastix strix]
MSEPTIEDVKGDEVPERLDTRESQEKEKTKKSNKKKAEAKEKKQPIQEKVKQDQSDSLSDSDSKDGEPSESSSSVSEIEEKKPEPVILADGRIDLQGNNNVVKKIIQEGSGLSPEKRSKVKVHYTGTLLDGTKFDSSVDRGEPFEFELGVGQVIQGWDIGVASMKKGEISDLTLDPCVAYGERGSPPSIPANAVLVFHVELLDFQNDLVSDEEMIEDANQNLEQIIRYNINETYLQTFQLDEPCDTIEFCPHEGFKNIMTIGTYFLNLTSKIKTGRIKGY